MSLNPFLFKKPKQKRSLVKFNKALESAEFLIEDQDIHSVTIKEIAKISDIKRPTLYKFFPTTFALFFALLKKHEKKILQIYKSNILDEQGYDLGWYINVLIDVIAIYINQNKVAGILILELNQISGSEKLNFENNKLMTNSFLSILVSQKINHSKETISLAVEICFSILSFGYRKEGFIGSRFIAEAKRAVLAYLSLK
tara:strand:- start:48 stop:644 length:597 start_codon:yes stop_codon:yes gene_type:complete